MARHKSVVEGLVDILQTVSPASALEVVEEDATTMLIAITNLEDELEVPGVPIATSQFMRERVRRLMAERGPELARQARYCGGNETAKSLAIKMATDDLRGLAGR